MSFDRAAARLPSMTPEFHEDADNRSSNVSRVVSGLAGVKWDPLAVLRRLARGDVGARFSDRRKFLIALAGIAPLATQNKFRFAAFRQFAPGKEVVSCGPAAVMIPFDRSQAIRADIRIA